MDLLLSRFMYMCHVNIDNSEVRFSPQGRTWNKIYSGSQSTGGKILASGVQFTRIFQSIRMDAHISVISRDLKTRVVRSFETNCNFPAQALEKIAALYSRNVRCFPHLSEWTRQQCLHNMEEPGPEFSQASSGSHSSQRLSHLWQKHFCV